MIIDIALIALIAFLTVMNHKERARLLDRIQARDLSEYKALTTESKKELKKPESKEIDFI
jgi:hypothetical protein